MTDYNATWWGKLYLAWKAYRAGLKDETGGGADSHGTPPNADNPAVSPPASDSTHRACFLYKDASDRCMNMLSPHMPDEKFKELCKKQLSSGCNTAYLFLSNKSDGNYAGYTMYKNNDIGVLVDGAKLAAYVKRIKYMHSAGLKTIFWLWADDSKPYWNVSEDRRKRYIADAVQNLDGLADGWVAALEWNENGSYGADEETMKRTLQKMRMHTERDIGVHFTTGPQTALANKVLSAIGGARSFYAQYGWVSASKLGDMTRKCRAGLDPHIRLIACEYDRNGGSHAHARAALENGAAGFGCGSWPVEVASAAETIHTGAVYEYA